MIPIKTYEVSIIIWKLRYRILITSLRFYTARKWLDEELFWKEIFQSYNCKIYCPFTLLPWLIKCVYELQVSNKRYSWSSVADRCLKHLFQVRNMVSSGFKGGERAKINRNFSLWIAKKKIKESCYFCPCSISFMPHTYTEYLLWTIWY